MSDRINKRINLRIDIGEFKRLPEYSCSIPTGPKIGFRWKCNKTAFIDPQPTIVLFGKGFRFRKLPAEWVIAETYAIGSKTEVGIEWFNPVITMSKVEWNEQTTFNRLVRWARLHRFIRFSIWKTRAI